MSEHWEEELILVNERLEALNKKVKKSLKQQRDLSKQLKSAKRWIQAVLLPIIAAILKELFGIDLPLGGGGS